MIFTILIILIWEILNLARVVIASLDIGDSISSLCCLSDEDMNNYRKSLIEVHLRDAITRLICSGSYVLIGIMAFVVTLFLTKADSALFNILFTIILFFVVGSGLVTDVANRFARKKIADSLKKNLIK